MIAVPHYISPADYLALEGQNPIRHEYRRGLVYAMTGGSDVHSRIAVNLLSLLNAHLDGTDCRLYNGDVKVNYAEDFYYYPDAFVTCDPRDRGDRYVKRHPKLIAEVLSPATAAFDQQDKFDDYCQIEALEIEALEEYVLISQESQRVEGRRRLASGGWETVVFETGARVVLASLELELPIAAPYRGID